MNRVTVSSVLLYESTARPLRAENTKTVISVRSSSLPDECSRFVTYPHVITGWLEIVVCSLSNALAIIPMVYHRLIQQTAILITSSLSSYMILSMIMVKRDFKTEYPISTHADETNRTVQIVYPANRGRGTSSGQGRVRQVGSANMEMANR